MYIDKQNTFFYKQAVTANVSSDVVMNGNGGDAEKSLWLVIRIDKDVTGTPLFNLYTSNTENIANAVLLHGITLAANAKAGTKVAVRLASGAKKYLKLNANNMTAGTITAFLTPDVRLVQGVHMEYIVKKKLYHNTLGLLNEGETVTFTKEEVAEYDKDYFDTLFETVGADETDDTDETNTDETVNDKPKKRGKKSEEPAE